MVQIHFVISISFINATSMSVIPKNSSCIYKHLLAIRYLPLSTPQEMIVLHGWWVHTVLGNTWAFPSEVDISSNLCWPSFINATVHLRKWHCCFISLDVVYLSIDISATSVLRTWLLCLQHLYATLLFIFAPTYFKKWWWWSFCMFTWPMSAKLI